MDAKSHWETIYGAKSPTEVSWYQPEAATSASLIRQVAPSQDAVILDAGGGASTLVDALVAHGYANVTIVDIAANALDASRQRLGAAAASVRWIASDVLSLDLEEHSIDVWHDRAVFHFLTTAEDRQRYVDVVRRALRPSGHVIVATFAEDGPQRCSGLPVERYDAQRLHGVFGAGFVLRTTLRELHVTPSGGQQAFRYCVCSYVPAAAHAA